MKKILSLMLAMILLLSMSCFIVSAADTVEFDDYEDGSRTVTLMDLDAGRALSPTVVAADGDNHAIKYDGADKAFSQWGFSFAGSSGTDFVEISYDIMFESFPTKVYGWNSNNLPDETSIKTGNQVFLQLGGGVFSWDSPKSLQIMRLEDNSVCLARNGSAIANTTLSENEWYNVKWMRAGGKSASIFLCFSKADGTVIWSQAIGSNSGLTKDYCLVMGTTYNGRCSDAQLLIDNMTKKTFAMSSGTLRMAEGSIEDEAENVLRNQKMNFGFDQLLDTSSEIAVTDSLGDPVATTQVVVGNRIYITFGLLERYETYTISFAGVVDKNSVSCTSEDITFTTEKVHFLDAPEIAGVTEVSGDAKVVFTLKDPHHYPKFTGILAAAGYDANNSLIAFDLISQADVTIGTETNATFDFGLSGITKVKLMVFDYADGIVPLAIGELTLE